MRLIEDGIDVSQRIGVLVVVTDKLESCFGPRRVQRSSSTSGCESWWLWGAAWRSSAPTSTGGGAPRRLDGELHHRAPRRVRGGRHRSGRGRVGSLGRIVLMDAQRHARSNSIPHHSTPELDRG